MLERSSTLTLSENMRKMPLYKHYQASFDLMLNMIDNSSHAKRLRSFDRTGGFANSLESLTDHDIQSFLSKKDEDSFTSSEKRKLEPMLYYIKQKKMFFGLNRSAKAKAYLDKILKRESQMRLIANNVTAIYDMVYESEKCILESLKESDFNLIRDTLIRARYFIRMELEEVLGQDQSTRFFTRGSSVIENVTHSFRKFSTEAAKFRNSLGSTGSFFKKTHSKSDTLEHKVLNFNRTSFGGGLDLVFFDSLSDIRSRIPFGGYNGCFRLCDQFWHDGSRIAKAILNMRRSAFEKSSSFICKLSSLNENYVNRISKTAPNSTIEGTETLKESPSFNKIEIEKAKKALNISH